MAGYVTGRNTVYEGLYQLQAGEVLVWDKAAQTLTRDRYYRFLPDTPRERSEDELVEELGALTDQAIQRVIEAASGAPVWVPLSGGLDSRLIACKLKEFGYDHVQTFSYGPPRNHEARVARRVARRLELPWRFMPCRQAAARRFFSRPTRREYWSFADGLCAVPNPQDLEPLIDLRDAGAVRGDAVIVNGQSGDFTSGGHVPDTLMSETVPLAALLTAITDKHYALWSDRRTPENLSRIEAKILRLLGVERSEVLAGADAVALYQLWEWQERQCKYVVNGQRIYDFLGLRWHLPLWDADLMQFWQSVPAPFLFGQRLYREYLARYDYRGLFRNFDPYVWRWPGSSILVVPLARAVGVVMGAEWKRNIYRTARYFGHSRNYYAPYPFRLFLKHAHMARNSLAFDVLTWMEENGLAEDRKHFLST